MYKAIIFDLDGTAIPNKPNGMPSKRLIKAVDEASEKIILCAATGRPLTNAKGILATLQLRKPCVISAGTQIVDPQTSEIIWQSSLNQDDVDRVIQICQPYPYELLMGDELVGEGGAASTRNPVSKPVNVMYVMGCTPEDSKSILEDLDKLTNITAAAVTSWTHNGVDIHITHRAATKEHAIAELLKILNIARESVIGVGDADNDVHLFAGVGYKVAMGNATKNLKFMADEVTKSVEDDGLAIVIEKYS